MTGEPRNNLGKTEAEWNAWRDAVYAWEADHPVRHTSGQICDCGKPGLRPGRPGHCAVRGPIAPWGTQAEHETFQLRYETSIAETERWMAERRVDWGPVSLADRTNRFGIFVSDGTIATARDIVGPFDDMFAPPNIRGKLRFLGRQPLFVAEVMDTLCWDGNRVQLHASYQRGVETCITKETLMLKKHGTGMIITDDTEQGRIARTAVVLTEAQAAGIIDEGDEADTEGE
ncbi:hypothetical protein [Streptomyces sp. NPDC088752]|uniref:hypothetical protein n=1 Tax=Streptomyces sp. NPDC088752 TaxID=3154963 RepID=UPI00342B0543